MLQLGYPNRDRRDQHRASSPIGAHGSRVLTAAGAVPTASSQGHSFWGQLVAMPVSTQIMFAIGLFLVGMFVYFVWTMIRRETNDRTIIRPAKKRARAPRRRGNASAVRGAWVGTDTARGARDNAELPKRIVEDDLPPITMVETRWRDPGEGPLPRHADLITGAASGEDETENAGVYKTGINPFFRSSQGIEVEEVANIETQAELMAHLGEYDTAIGLLTRHIRETERPAPKAWLMLFDLYTKNGREEQYKNLAKGFRILFNAEVPSWEQQRGGAQRYIEDYPRVMEKIERLWGMPTCKAFLESLIYDDRGGDRQGFMLAAYNDIIFLLDIIEAFDHIMAAEEEKKRIEAKLQEDRRI